MRYVVAVAEELSFTRAAARCHVVQSALSHQVKALERELGVVLFARTSRRVALTPAGEAFLPHARAAIAAAGAARDEALAATGTLSGRLRVGVIPTVTAIDLPAALAAFHATHPGVDVELRTGGSDAFLSALAAGHLDVALLGLPATHTITTSGVGSRVLSRGRHVAVLPPGHHLTTRSQVRLADLADEPFVDFPTGTPGREQTDQAFTTAGLARTVPFEAMTLDLITGLIAHGLAIALLPQAAISPQRMIMLPVVDGPTRVEHLAWTTFNPSPACRAFLAHLESTPTPAPIPT